MNELLNDLPKELVDNLDKLEYQEDGGILINSVQLIEKDLQVDFTLSFGGYNIPQQIWSIDIKEIKKEKITIEWTNYTEIYSDHYLLYEFIDNFTELYFNCKADNSERLFIDLYQIHKALYNLIDFGTYINAIDGLTKLCNSEYGLFARGPKNILTQYEKCLINHGVKTKY